ncbi:MAG: molybdopterin molybdotransferase MoeA, partial [Candidatus Entotheonellia bacterium]
PIPEGADAVVRREDTEWDGDVVQIFRPAQPREYVVFPGRDIPQGALLLRRGDVITPGAVGLLASLGRTRVPVFERPRIGVLALGDELIPPETPLQPGQIRVSNLYTIAACITRYGGEAINLGIASDRLEMIQAALERAQDADVLLTLGGSQRGDFDLVHEVLSPPRGELIFREIAVNYARSMIFGHFGRIPFCGLPGSPMTSFVAFEAFVRPALWKLAGRRVLEWPRVEALLSEPLPAATVRALFHPVWVEARAEGLMATPLRLEKAADLPPQALANALIYCAPESPACPAGTRVWVNLLEPVGTSQSMGG